MERTFSPMIRQFSAIDGLQKAYTLVYSLDAEDENGCRLTLCRTGSGPRMESLYLAAAPESCYRILQYLCEKWRAAGDLAGCDGGTDHGRSA